VGLCRCSRRPDGVRRGPREAQETRCAESGGHVSGREDTRAGALPQPRRGECPVAPGASPGWENARETMEPRQGRLRLERRKPQSPLTGLPHILCPSVPRARARGYSTVVPPARKKSAAGSPARRAENWESAGRHRLSLFRVALPLPCPECPGALPYSLQKERCPLAGLCSPGPRVMVAPTGYPTRLALPKGAPFPNNLGHYIGHGAPPFRGGNGTIAFPYNTSARRVVRPAALSALASLRPLSLP